jgi:hypothetical protein
VLVLGIISSVDALAAHVQLGVHVILPTSTYPVLYTEVCPPDTVIVSPVNEGAVPMSPVELVLKIPSTVLIPQASWVMLILTDELQSVNMLPPV